MFNWIKFIVFKNKSLKIIKDFDTNHNIFLGVFRIIDFFTKFINKSITNYIYTYKIYNYTK